MDYLTSDLTLLIASVVALPAIVLMVIWVKYVNKELRVLRDAEEDNE